jgi:hypothetical protein
MSFCSGGIANAFFSHLEYLRPRVVYSEGLSACGQFSLIEALFCQITVGKKALQPRHAAH